MRFYGLCGLAALVILIVGAVGAASSFGALPDLLPAASAIVIDDGGGESRLSVLGNGLSMVCKKHTSEEAFPATAEPRNKGTYHIAYSECSAQINGTSIGPCTGLGDTTSGVILSLGEVNLVYDSLSPLGVALLFDEEVTPTHYECKSIVTTLVTLKGKLLCLLEKVNVSTVKNTLKCETLATAGDQKETEYYNDSGVLTKAVMLSAQSEGSFADESEELTSNLTCLIGNKEAACEIMG